MNTRKHQKVECRIEESVTEFSNICSDVLIARTWSEFNNLRDRFVELGFIRFPPLSTFVDIERYAKDVIGEIKDKTFVESSPAHVKLLDALEVKAVLAPILFDIAKDKFGYTGDLDSQCHMARLVKPGNAVEQYRAHFDSHIFTLIIPLVIPANSLGKEVGELLFMPNARRNPESEFENIAGKVFFKIYARKSSVLRLEKDNKFEVEFFSDYRPLLFLGRTTFHVNKPVALGASSARLTLLSHFFDPGPKFGIGKIMRSLRNR
ncbi:hypothetical protein [Litchfieldella qijiaojingensis]|uniref:hypothetical protein n=1 Tax=Litchfieldella qijiaojingensis TaxID=980347 RepID=UPI001679E674|nr:hypothetical protein [Halomonas qijiaojingensis]